MGPKIGAYLHAVTEVATTPDQQFLASEASSLVDHGPHTDEAKAIPFINNQTCIFGLRLSVV